MGSQILMKIDKWGTLSPDICLYQYQVQFYAPTFYYEIFKPIKNFEEKSYSSKGGDHICFLYVSV